MGWLRLPRRHHRPPDEQGISLRRLLPAHALSLSELVLLAMVLLVCAGLLAVARLRAPSIDIPIAAERLDGLAFVDGIYGREQADGAAFRWTSGSAVVQLRGAAHIAPAYIVTLHLHAANPAGPQELAILANGRPLAALLPEVRTRIYRLLVAPGDDAELRLNLRTASFVAAENPRPLGVVLSALQLRPLPQIAWPVVGTVALSLLALWALLRARGTAARPALTLVALAGAGLAAAAAIGRPAPLPFLALACLFLLAVATIALLAKPLAARMALVALALLVCFSGVLWPSWLSDDAFISFRYAQNLAAGNGLVYNLGERVEGYTNFLWTLLAAGVIAGGGDVATWSYAAGVALALAILLGTYSIAARLCGPAWGLVAALVVGSSQSLLLYTARGAGLETGLFTLLVLVGCALSLDDFQPPARRAAAGILFALASLTRPEGLLVFALTILAELRLPLAGRHDARRSAIAWLLGSYLLIFLPYFAWRFSYYGDLLPNTFYAKTGGGLRQIVRGFQYAAGFALALGGPLLLLVGVPWLRNWRSALASWRGYVLLVVVGYSAYIVAVGGDHFRGERFFVPLLPLLAVLLADGISATYAMLSRGKRAQAAMLIKPLLAVTLALGSFGALARTAPADATIRGLDESVWIWRELGWWMADHTPANASIAAKGAGAVAYYGQRTTIDLFGLTDRHIARVEMADMGAGVAGHEKQDPAYVLDLRRPTYIPQIWDDYFGGAAALRERYSLIPIRTRSGRELFLWELRP